MRYKFFDEAADLFWLWDKDLNLIDVNQSALRLFHMKKEDIVGKNITQLSPDAKASGRFDAYKEVMRTGKTLQADDVVPHPSLGNFHLRVKAFRVGDGLGTMATNVTDLAEAISELETFIYKSSHDMRSPIASILGLTQLADTHVKDLNEAKHFCKLVNQQTERLDTILKTLIQTTRIREGEKTIHSIDFRGIITDVLKSLEFKKGFNEVKFEQNISVKQKFYSDKLLLISLFQNLIDNAIKYRKEGSKNSFIKISVADENGGVKITVADNGIGIPESLQKDVFKMFFRATDKASGSGLGLYTVKHTVKKLGGTISLDSKEKMGTTFTVYVPSEKVNGNRQTK